MVARLVAAALLVVGLVAAWAAAQAAEQTIRQLFGTVNVALEQINAR